MYVYGPGPSLPENEHYLMDTDIIVILFLMLVKLIPHMLGFVKFGVCKMTIHIYGDESGLNIDIYTSPAGWTFGKIHFIFDLRPACA